MYLFSIRVTQFESHSSQASGSPTFARVSPKYFNTEIVEYYTILIIEIVFGENTKKKKTREENRRLKKSIPTPDNLVATQLC